MDLELIVSVVAVIATLGGMILYQRLRTTPGRQIKGDNVFQDVWVTVEDIQNEKTLTLDDPSAPGQKISVRLPPEASHGWAMRIEGKGLNGRGDLYLRIKVDSPYRRV